MMKKSYMQIDLKIVAFSVCDVIRTSGESTEDPLFVGDNVVSDWN